MKLRMFGFAIMVASLVCGCGSAQQSAGAPSAQATARAAVSVAADVWNMTAQGCIAMAEAKEDDTIRQKCAAVLLPAHDSIEAAADAVDGWAAGGSGNFPCLMADVLDGLKQIDALIVSLGQKMPQIVLDAEGLAEAFVPQCVQPVDAGSAG